MGIFLANGTRVTKGSVATSAVPAADLPKVLSNDLFESVSYGRQDPKPQGSMLRLLAKAGTVMTQSQIDNLFPVASIATVAPATGLAAGGTTLTITGTELDGVTAVTVKGVAATSVTVVSSTKITCVTAAGTAGAGSVVLTDDSGTITKANAYTYT